MKVAIVKSNFYPDLSSGLFNGARQEFLDSGGLVENIKTFQVPGAFEVPSAVSKVLIHKSNYFDAVITLGVLVKGETDHYDHICRSVTDRISELSIESPIPIIYGILTVASAVAFLKVVSKETGPPSIFASLPNFTYHLGQPVSPHIALLSSLAAS